MAGGVEVEGMAGFRRALDRAADTIGDLTEPNAQAAAIVGQTVRDTTAPRKTGALARSTSWHGTREGSVIESGVRYAAAVHARNPFIRRAFEQTEERWADVYLAHVESVVEDIAKSGV